MILKDEMTISERYTQEEQDFIQKIKKARIKKIHLKKSDYDRICTGRKMNPGLDFLPTEKEMDEYISSSLKRIFDDSEYDQ